MNKETEQIYNYIQKSGHYLQKINELKNKFNNIKDFQLMLSYVIIEIINEEPSFIHLKRTNIEFDKIALHMFT